MPHLTRRFTLLRAPDGSMVTPDAMRAQLRAQRARARAAGQPGGNFLTEQEEDEIIDQMQRQTRLMELEAGSSLERHNFSDRWNFQNRILESDFGPIGSGSDGFGNLSADRSIASYYSGGTTISGNNATNRLDSLAESLGELKSVIHSASSGSLFSGRSSERDYAYLRSLNHKKSPGMGTFIAEESEEEEEDHPHQASDADGSANRHDDDEEAKQISDVDMPGGFGASMPSSRRTSKRDTSTVLQRLGTGDDNDSAGDALDDPTKSPKALETVEHNSSEATRSAQSVSSADRSSDTSSINDAKVKDPVHSSVLSSLSPDAFRRVSTALEEVIGVVSPRSLACLQTTQRLSGLRNQPTPIDHVEYEIDAISGESGDDESIERNVTQRHGVQRAAFEGEATGLPVAQSSAESDSSPSRGEVGMALVDDDHFHGVGKMLNVQDRDTSDSDATSFQSAREGTAASVAHGAFPTEPDAADKQQCQRSGHDGDSDDATDRTSKLSQQERTPLISSHQWLPQGSATPQCTGEEESMLRGDENTVIARSDTQGAVNCMNRTAHSNSLDQTSAANGHNDLMRDGANNLSLAAPSLLYSSREDATSPTAHTPVLSAGAIAARSQRYFPGVSSSSTAAIIPEQYASGFKNSPATPLVAGSPMPASNIPFAAPAASASNALPRVPQVGEGLRRSSLNGGMRIEPPRLSEDVLSPTTGRMFPRTPEQNPPLAHGWRGGADPQCNELKNDDDVSIGDVSDSNLSGYEERLMHDGDSDDVWARVAKKLDAEKHEQPALLGSNSECQRGEESRSMNSVQAMMHSSPQYASQARPYSHLPPNEAASQFEGAGFTVSTLAAMQDTLVRSASHRQNHGETVRPGQSEGIPPLSPGDANPELISKRSMSPTSFAKLEQARARARMIAERVKSPQGSQNGSPHKIAFSGSHHQRSLSEISLTRSTNGEAIASPGRDAVLSLSSDPQPRPSVSSILPSSSFKSQVMYDVTTSHRPTSPPPRRKSGASSILPSLQDLSLMGGFQPTLPAVDARKSPATPPPRARDDNGEIKSDSPTGDIDFQECGVVLGESILEENPVGHCGDPYEAAEKQQAPSLVGPHGDIPTIVGLSHSQSQSVLSSGRNGEAGKSPASVQTSWSDPYSSNKTVLPYSANLVDDVANQARSATSALKGPQFGDGRPHLAPRKSKILSRRKAKKNPGKYIGIPELLCTSQHMGHAQPIPDAVLQSSKDKADGRRTESGSNKKISPRGMRPSVTQEKRRPPVRQASDYKNDPKTVPATLLHRRASSSFGHSGQLGEDSTGPQAHSQSSYVAPQPLSHFVPGMAMHRAPSPPSSRSRLASPDTPGSNKSAEGRNPSGGLGRLMSRMRMRKSPGLEDSTSATSAPGTPVPSAGFDGTSSLGVASKGDQNCLCSTGEKEVFLPDPSPFGISAFNAQSQSMLPESGATYLTTSVQSPTLERGDIAAGEWSTREQKDVEANIWNNIISIEGDDTRFDEARRSSQDFDVGGLVPIPWAQTHGGAANEINSVEHVPSATGGATTHMMVSTSQDTIYADEPQSTQGNFQSQRSFATSNGPGATSEAFEDISASISKIEKRKSARETVVRRTLIFPNEAAAAWAAISEERRKSVVSIAPSVASKRKSIASRRTNYDVGDDEEANASYAALLAAANSDGNGRFSTDDNIPLRAPAPNRFGTASLRPPSMAGYSTRRTSAVDGGSYAGSLYDMYIDEEGGGVGSEEISLRSSFYPPAGTAGNHIEVTERADGSIVWQVIAGLGRGVNGANSQSNNRKSNYSTGEASRASASGAFGHSRGNSDASQFSFFNRPPRDSLEDPAMSTIDAARTPATVTGASFERTFTGMLQKDEDARSLFARRRPPVVTDQTGGDKGAVAALELPLPPFIPNRKDSLRSNDASRPASGLNAQQQLAFDMATPGASGMTRIVYSNDVELEQLLESLANQNDAAMFHFDPKQYYAQAQRAAAAAASRGGSDVDIAGLAVRPLSTVYREGAAEETRAWPRDVSSDSDRPRFSQSEAPLQSSARSSSSGQPRDSEHDFVRADTCHDVIDPRRRVEDEIMTLLTRGGIKAPAMSTNSASDDPHSHDLMLATGDSYSGRIASLTQASEAEEALVSFDMLDSAVRPESGHSQQLLGKSQAGDDG